MPAIVLPIIMHQNYGKISFIVLIPVSDLSKRAFVDASNVGQC